MVSYFPFGDDYFERHDNLDMFDLTLDGPASAQSARSASVSISRSTLPRCPVLNFSRDGDSISAQPLAKTDTAGIAARVRAIDDAFFLEEFSSKAFNFVKNEGSRPVQPITWRARHSSTDLLIDSDEDDVAADVEELPKASATPPGSPILTLSNDEMSENATSQSRSTSSSLERGSPHVSDPQSTDEVSTNETSHDQIISCIPTRRKSGLAPRMFGENASAGIRPEDVPSADVTGFNNGSTPAEATPGGIPRRISRGIRRALGRRDPSPSDQIVNQWDTTCVTEDFLPDPYVDMVYGCLPGIVRDIPVVRKGPAPPPSVSGKSDLWISPIGNLESDALRAHELSSTANDKLAIIGLTPRRSGPEISPFHSDPPDAYPSRAKSAWSHPHRAPQDSDLNRYGAHRWSGPVRLSPRTTSALPCARATDRFERDTAPRASSSVAKQGPTLRNIGRAGCAFRRKDRADTSGRVMDDYISFSVSSPPPPGKRRSRWWF